MTLPVREHIKEMDAVGIDKTVLFSTTFHPEKSTNFAEIKTSMEFLSDLLAGKKSSMVEARQKSVSELVGAITQYPDRYIGFGAVPVGLDLDATLQYVSDVICQNHLAGMRGTCLSDGYGNCILYRAGYFTCALVAADAPVIPYNLFSGHLNIHRTNLIAFFAANAGAFIASDFENAEGIE